MFLHNENDASGPHAISQSSHAWMAWQIASHWGNRRFARPAPRAEVGAAVLLHDVGWSEFDAAPDIDPDGRPLTFDRMAVEEHLEIWRSCVSQTALISRYAAVLVASHFAALAAGKAAELEAEHDRPGARLVENYRSETEDFISSRTAELSADTRYEPFLDGSKREVNALVLSACDRISVALTANLPTPFPSEAATRDGHSETIALKHVGDRIFRLDPWPLEGDRLTIHCEGRRLGAARFQSKDRFREALRDACVERLSFTLLRPSAKAG